MSGLVFCRVPAISLLAHHMKLQPSASSTFRSKLLFFFPFSRLPHTDLLPIDNSVQIEGGLPFVIKNDKGASYMAFDALELKFCNF